METACSCTGKATSIATSPEGISRICVHIKMSFFGSYNVIPVFHSSRDYTSSFGATPHEGSFTPNVHGAFNRSAPSHLLFHEKTGEWELGMRLSTFISI